MSALPKYTHRCVIQSGHMAGTKYSHEVDPYEYESGALCPHCRSTLATTEQLVAYMYDCLTDPQEA